MVGVKLVKPRVAILKTVSPKICLPGIPKNGVNTVFCFLPPLKGFYPPGIEFQAHQVPAMGHRYRLEHHKKANSAAFEKTNKKLLDLVVIIKPN